MYPGSIPGVASKKNLVLIKKKSKLRFLHSSVAQLVEQLTVNQLVAGSSPARGAKFSQPVKFYSELTEDQKIKFAKNLNLNTQISKAG